MTIRRKFFIAFALILITSLASLAVNGLVALKQFRLTGEMAHISEVVAQEHIPLIELAKNIQLDVARVQAVVSDIAAVRTPERLESGLKEVEGAAESFHHHQSTAAAAAEQLGLSDSVRALDGIKLAFDVYYEAGVRMARRLVEEYGVRGFKFHPSMQGFAPNDPIAYPLYEAIEEMGVPALFHTGQTGIGAGVPGGGGIRLKYSDPMLVDDVAVDFPHLRIILAHPSFPWQDEALAVAVHKPYVHIDLSGWSPKYFPPQLVRYANTLLKDKVLFGSDYPVITPDRWLADFDRLEIKPEVRPKILKNNAARLLGLTGAGPADKEANRS